ncbi:MAG: GGDEF domain-containing protein [Aquabacterium sp.]|jgi:diguanylate cyclase (GGDEF)-like protein|nr:MAG: GGDEF domain-containing protein [Aquabacterium sp.]
MVTIDVQTCFVLTGFGAALGGCLMQLTRTDEPRIREALFRYKLGLVLLVGMGLQALFPPEPALRIAIALAAGGVTCLGWGFHSLNGRQTSDAVFLVSVAIVLAITLAAAAGSPATFLWTLTTTFAAVGAIITVDQGVIVLRNPKLQISELILMLLAAAFTLDWLLILHRLMTVDAPIPPHWVYAPQWLLPWSALAYAVLPITVATAALMIINDRLMQTLRNRALSDDLTGALSRRGLRELGEQMLAMQAAHPNLVAVLMLDVDHFKSINDRYGHLVGDDVLRHLTAIVREHLRTDALFARYGGEEFTVLLPLRSVDEALVVAERLRHAVESSPCESRVGQVPITISVGVAYHRPDGTLDEALGRADERLYLAKQAGRNRVVAGGV